MKQTSLLKTMLLLCALVVGSSAWADTKPWTGDDPETTLDLQTITSSTMGTWYGESAWYLDDSYLVVTGYESYKSVENQTWITQLSVGSSGSTWEASAPFKGSSYYTNANYATLQNGRYIVYKVTNLKSLKVYGKNNATSKYLDIFIYTKSGSNYTKVEEIKYTTDNNVHIWENSETLDPAETYFVYITGVGGSNSRLFEVAFERNTLVTKHALSSAVSPVSAGTVSLGATEVGEGSTTTITATPNAGYVFSNWTVSGTGASVADASTASTTFTMGTTDATVTANFNEKPKHDATFYVLGSIVGTDDDVYEGEAITFPSVTAPTGFAFVGWTKNVIATTQVDAPADLVNAANMGNADVTYHAVFATAVGTPATLTKMVTGDTFAANDKVVIVAAIDESTNYGLYQETTNSSYVKNYSFTENVESVASNDKNWWTVTAGTDGKWKLGDATNGYLYSSSSNNLSVVTDNASEWTLVDNEDGTFSLNQGRYLSCRSDLSGTNQYLYRLAGSTPAGVYKLNIYKYVAGGYSYSNYRTTITVETPAVTAAGWATYVTPYNLEFAEGDAFVVSAATASAATLAPVTKIGANKAVLLKGEGVKTATVLNEAPAAVANELAISTGGEINGYVLAKKSGVVGFYKWAGGSLTSGKVYLPTPAGAREYLEFAFEDDNETTGLSEELRMKNEESAAAWYDLQGRKVAQPTKGLYIVNGKKVVIK